MSLVKVQAQLDSLQAQVDALKQIQDLTVRATADGTEYVVVNVSGTDYKMLASTFFKTPSVTKSANFTLAVSNKNSILLIDTNSVEMTIPTSLGWAIGDACFVWLGGTGFTLDTTGLTITSPETLDDTQYSWYFIVKTAADEFTISQLGLSGGGSGTVTSVAVSGSDGIEVDSGSPVTSSGTIALGLNKANTLTFLNVEDGADVTDATNVDAAGAVMNSDTSTSAMGFVIDEDNMSSDSDTKVPTQQSVKAYVDSQAGNEFADNVFRIQDNSDATKEIAFEASGITTSTTRTITMPDADVDLGLIPKLATYSLSNGQIKSTTEVNLIADPGSGKVLFVSGIILKLNYDTAAFNYSGPLFFYSGSNPSDGSSSPIYAATATDLNRTSSHIYQLTEDVNSGFDGRLVDDGGLYCRTTIAPSSGSGTIDLYITYYEITL